MKLFNTTGTKKYRKALRKTQTDAEKKLWSRLRNKSFYGYKFYRQYGIGKYIADFYCPKLKLVVEADGGQHYEEKGKMNDMIRSEYFALAQIKVLRFNDRDILMDLDSVLTALTQELPPAPLYTKEGR